MPTLQKKLSKGYYYKDSIKNVSKQLEQVVISNYKNQFAELAKQEKTDAVVGGAKRQIKVFNKKIKQKIMI
jgi:hypothetical protein